MRCTCLELEANEKVLDSARAARDEVVDLVFRQVQVQLLQHLAWVREACESAPNAQKIKLRGVRLSVFQL